MNAKIFFIGLILCRNVLILESAKVRERFKNYPRNVTVTMAGLSLPPGSESAMEYIEQFYQLVKGLRIVLQDCGKEGTGTVTNFTTGKYNGMLGCVQEGITDTLVVPVRPDSTPFEPGIFITMGAVADSPKLYTFNAPNITLYPVDILYFYSNIDRSIWIYALISLVVSSIMSLYATYSLFGKFDIRSSPYLTILFLSMSTTLGVLYGYHHVLLNTLSSDLSVPMSIRSLESVDDLLYDPKFSHIRPVVYKGMATYNTLRSAIPGSKGYEIYQRMVPFKEKSFLETGKDQWVRNEREKKDFEEFQASALAGESVLIENSVYVNIFIRYAYCKIDPEGMKNVKEVNDEISSSALSLLISKKSSKQVLDCIPLADYRMQTAAELGTLLGMVQSKSYNMYEDMYGRKVSVKGLVCSEKASKTHFNSLDLSWKPFDLEPFDRLILICLSIMSIATIILWYEILLRKFIPIEKKRERSAVVLRTRSAPQLDNFEPTLVSVAAAVAVTTSRSKPYYVEQGNVPEPKTVIRTNEPFVPLPGFIDS